MKINYKNIFIVLILFFSFSCEKQNSKFVNLSDMHVYMTDTKTDNHMLAFDAVPVNGGVAIFCVSGNIKTKYRAKGSLVLLKINENGDIELQKSYAEIEDGFPADVLSTDQGFQLFWNISSGEFKRILINKNTLEIVENTTITIVSNFSCNYITSALEHNNKILLQGIGNDEQENNIYKKTFIALSDDTKNSYKAISANDYNPLVFGGFGDEDIAMLQGMPNSFKMYRSSDNYLFYSTPFKNKIVIKEVGDPVPVFANSENWISAMNVNNDGSFSAIFNNSVLGTVNYYPSLFLKSENTPFNLYDNANQYIELKNVDTDEAINIVEGEYDMIVVTNNSGQLAVHSYINGKHIEKIIGKTYPYRPINAHIQGDELIIIGNTDVEYQFKRVFLMKIPLNELE